MSTNWLELEKTARDWTYEAGEIIKRSLTDSIHIESKDNPDDLVTEVDRAVEQFFYEKITNTFPAHKFLGEEGVAEQLQSLDGIVWIIDPIDGTMNFVHQQINFAISVSVYYNGVGKIGIIYDVMDNKLFHAVKGEGAYVNEEALTKVKERPLNEAIVGLNGRWLTKEKHTFCEPLKELVRDVRGMRSYGSAAIEIAHVASNRLDSYISVSLSPWDYAAGVVIANEVGYEATTFSGEPVPLLSTSSVIVAKPELHKEIIDSYLGDKNK